MNRDARPSPVPYCDATPVSRRSLRYTEIPASRPGYGLKGLVLRNGRWVDPRSPEIIDIDLLPDA